VKRTKQRFLRLTAAIRPQDSTMGIEMGARRVQK
jgi:hypothetical protein